MVRTQKCHRWPIRQVNWLEARERIVTVTKDECAFPNLRYFFTLIFTH